MVAFRSQAFTVRLRLLTAFLVVTVCADADMPMQGVAAELALSLERSLLDH